MFKKFIHNIALNYRLIISFLFFVISILVLPSTVFANSNNKFGIHLSQPTIEDIKTAAALLNSNGGDWGYVTLVLQDNDLEHDKWQNIFDELRKLHLIPILRLATHPKGKNWTRSKNEDIKRWVRFLNSLNWVIKQRYIILFNEPNHAQEWGGKTDPVGYTTIAYEFAKELKESNSDYFIMLGALDFVSPHRPPLHESEVRFLRAFVNKKGLFNYIDGWASHSYPQDYLSPPWKKTAQNIRNYQWELNFLKRHGVNKDLPVFITETGWLNTARNAGEYIKYAFERVWLKDTRVRAVTPFILNYKTLPFQKFSWIKKNGDYYPIFKIIKSMKKVAGKPQIIDKGSLLFFFPEKLSISSVYHLTLTLKNTGQAIWNKEYNLKIDDSGALSSYFFSSLPHEINPFQEASLEFSFKTSKKLGKHHTTIYLLNKKRRIVASLSQTFTLTTQPNLIINLSVFPKLNNNYKELEVQIFNSKEELIFKKDNLTSHKGKLTLLNIPNIAFGEKYRVVVLKPFYLPRQKIITFTSIQEEITLKPLLPLDINLDGKFSLNDIAALFLHPTRLRYLIP